VGRFHRPKHATDDDPLIDVLVAMAGSTGFFQAHAHHRDVSLAFGAQRERLYLLRAR
jgi:hypothetical protein